jgi:hypothetical protein
MNTKSESQASGADSRRYELVDFAQVHLPAL